MLRSQPAFSLPLRLLLGLLLLWLFLLLLLGSRHECPGPQVHSPQREEQRRGLKDAKVGHHATLGRLKQAHHIGI